jgi:predicted metal-dependent phosphotriesterase family hydrolase
MSEISAEKLVSAYLKLRTARQELKKQYDTEDASLEKQQNMVSEKLQDMMKEVGADSLKTKFGTVSRSIKIRYWPSDWGAMYDFIREHNVPDLLEQRISQSKMKAFLDENPELLPKGLNADSRYTVTVYKPRNR